MAEDLTELRGEGWKRLLAAAWLDAHIHGVVAGRRDQERHEGLARLHGQERHTCPDPRTAFHQEMVKIYGGRRFMNLSDTITAGGNKAQIAMAKAMPFATGKPAASNHGQLPASLRET